MLRLCTREVARLHPRSHHRQWSSLPTSSCLAPSGDPSEDADDLRRPTVSRNNVRRGLRPSPSILLVGTTTTTTGVDSAADLRRHSRDLARAVATTRRFSISRHADVLTQHGTVNTLDDDDDVDDIIVSGNGGGGGMDDRLTADEMDRLWDDMGDG
eukprot:CAMPEP_0181116368 /NCGR_PEP_ID=MMETSP1071-20121207/21912_1 /TAXON_ID=35127 /ORGANISM="Thalassiosira sp., Strain NH16" /LENGTH=155 /DNA_ID=CAMNT_0023200605 /DNA_START=27 /DNA_END=491 /DNA_ORIENTATION=+